MTFLEQHDVVEQLDDLRRRLQQRDGDVELQTVCEETQPGDDVEGGRGIQPSGDMRRGGGVAIREEGAESISGERGRRGDVRRRSGEGARNGRGLCGARTRTKLTSGVPIPMAMRQP